MAYIGGYATGSSYSSDRYSTVDELLVQLPDNTGSLINAQDVRDSVYSLWARIDDVQSLAATAASQSFGVVYSNATPTPVTVGGISAGSTFSNYTMQQMWNALLYPYIAPGRSLSVSPTQREYGAPLALSLNWSVTKNTNTITSIVVDGSPVIPTGNSQAGSQGTTATHSVSPSNPSTSQSYSMSVSDGTSTPTTSTTFTWKTRIYWGKIDFSSIGNPNLTTNPGSASLCATVATDTVIKNLDGAGANGAAVVSGNGTELATSKNKTYTSIDGAGQYLIFAWPSIVGGATAPSFNVNNLPNTAFTRIRTNSGFSNSFGFTGINYEVWVSNTAQNSPLTIVIS